VTRVKRCRCCGKPLAGPVRFCVKCKRPIERHDKWFFVKGRMQHRHCQFPDAYLTPKEYKLAYGHDPY